MHKQVSEPHYFNSRRVLYRNKKGKNPASLLLLSCLCLSRACSFATCPVLCFLFRFIITLLCLCMLDFSASDVLASWRERFTSYFKKKIFLRGRRFFKKKVSTRHHKSILSEFLLSCRLGYPPLLSPTPTWLTYSNNNNHPPTGTSMAVTCCCERL